MRYIERLRTSWSKNNSLLCVGLDPDIARLPEHVRAHPKPVFSFNKAIIDATADLVCAYKPQAAYYAAQRAEAELELTIEYIRDRFPELLVIFDAKRGDVGSTASLYAAEAFSRYGADAVTVNPYLGLDSLVPFLDYADKGVIVLCRTSNQDSAEIQELEVQGRKLYEVIAEKAVSTWNYNGNISLVVGATFPDELRQVRSMVGDMPLLVPGIGAQGGDLQATVINGQDSKGAGMIINSSRRILYASNGKDFDQSARRIAEQTRDRINRYRKAPAKNSP